MAETGSIILAIDTSLSRIVRSTERYGQKVNLFNDSFNAMNKVLDKVKSVDERKVQEFINNSSIGENIDKVNSTRKEMALSWSNLGNSFKESSEVLYNASGSAWNISRATFLNVKAIKGLKSLKNIHQIRQAKKAVDSATLVSLMAHIGSAIYKNDMGNDIGSTDELISSLSIFEDELKTLRSKGGKYLAIASDAAQMIVNIRELNKLNEIDDSVFNDESRTHIKRLKTTIQNKVSMGISSVTASLLQDSNIVLAGAATVAKELHNSFRETDNVRKNKKTQFDLKVSEKTNNRMDAVLVNVADTQDYFQNELGEKVLENINLEVELGFIESSKKKEQPIAENDQINEDKETIPEQKDEPNEQLAEKTKSIEDIPEAKQLKEDNDRLSVEYQELYIESKQNPDDENLQQRLKAKKTELGNNAYAFQQLRDNSDYDIVNEKGNPVLVDGFTNAKDKAENSLQTLRNDLAEQQSIKDETVKKEQDKKPRNSSQDKNRQALDKAARANLKVAEKIQGKNESLSKLNNQINSKRSEIDNLKQQLAQIGSGSSASKADRFKARSNFIKYKIIKRIYDKYNGDITKVSSSDRSKIKTLSNTLSGSWVRVFQNAPSRYANARDINNQLSSAGGSSSDAQSIRQQINQLESQIVALSNEAQEIQGEQQALVSQFEDSKRELSELVSDINDTNKQDIATENNSNELFPDYEGGFSALTDGGITTAHVQADQTDGETQPVLNGALYPTNNDGVYTGDYRIDSKTSVDGATTYTYASWGKWNVSSPPQLYTESSGHVNQLVGGHWVIGRVAKDIPKQGSAIFQGTVSGDHRSSAGILDRDSITGAVQLNANFANETLSGNIAFKHNGAAWANSSLNNGVIELDDGSIDANLTGGGNGGLHGNFYGVSGNTPVEAGGGWWLQNSDGSHGAGIFRAKKQ